MNKVILSIVPFDKTKFYTFLQVKKYYSNKENLKKALKLREESFLKLCVKKNWKHIEKYFSCYDILSKACQYYNLKLVKKTVDRVDKKDRYHGATSVSNFGYTGLKYVDSNTNKQILKLIKFLVEEKGVEMKDEGYCISMACWNGNLELVKFLLDKGSDIHYCDDSPFRFACQWGHFEIIKYLIFREVVVLTNYLRNWLQHQYTSVLNLFGSN